MDDPARTARIAALNDSLRQAPGPGWMLSDGVAELGIAVAAEVMVRIGATARFQQALDPRGERRAGALVVLGRSIRWEISYYDITLRAPSPDPADDRLTRRILAVMLAGE